MMSYIWIRQDLEYIGIEDSFTVEELFPLGDTISRMAMIVAGCTPRLKLVVIIELNSWKLIQIQPEWSSRMVRSFTS